MPVTTYYFPHNFYPVIIIDTDEDNNIVGTYFNDAIDGRLGSDEISGLGGHDAISGNTGNDTINGNEGYDFLIGHQGNDRIAGGRGRDVIIGVDPTSGFGTSERDILRGDAGADTFVLGDKNNVYYVDYDTSSVGEEDYGLIVDFTPGEDTIELNGSPDNYLLDFYTTSDGTITADIVYDPGIAARGELIGILEDVSADLKLTDSSFVYGENDYAVLYNQIFQPLEPLPPGTYFSGGLILTDPGVGDGVTIRQDFIDPPIFYNPPSNGEDGGSTIISGPNIPPNIIEGTSDDDVLIGTENIDIIYGYEGNDHLSGLGDNDTILGGEGEDTITGGEGNDSLEGEDDNDTIYGGTGEDTIVGGEGNDSLEGEEDDDVITGDGGNDVIWGGSGNDHLSGGSDDDHITGGTGEDTITGGEGDDTVTGGEGNDSLDGGEDNDVITGEGGHDDLRGGLGDDTIYGGAGDDTIYGDVYYDYYEYGDEPVYNSGNDLIAGESGNDYLDGGLGDDTIYGGTGNDTIYGGGGDDSLEGGENDDNIYGSDGNDVIAGDSGDDDLRGGLGDDTISGGTGDDTIFGEENFFGYGTDIYFFQSYSVSYDPYQEFYNVGNDSIEGDSGNDVILGGLGDDTISGGTGDDTIFGDIYNLYYEEDYEEDYNGNDSIEGDSGNDYLLGRLGDDTISGGTGDDTIFGETGNDIISGGTGDDSIFGGEGNDIISGTTSDSEEIDEIDELTGGLGSDRFILGDEIGVYYDDGDPVSLGESDFASITDFNAEQDFIQLHGPREFYYLDFYEYYDDYGSDDRFIGVALMYDPGVTARRELIGIIHNVAEDLTLEDASFIFVGDQQLPEPTINANLENNDVPPPIINQAPADITLTFNQPDTIYHPKDDLILQGNVFDANGAEDLSYVEIYLQYPNQAVVPLEKITEFDDQGNFEQELDLDGYAHGTYVFWMQATDQQGLNSQWFSTSFSINNQAPDSLTLELDSHDYHPSQTLTLSGIANDPDGIEDVSHVNLYLQHPNGTWTTLDPVTDFDNNGHFNQELNLEGYGVGNYGVWGQVFDSQGLNGEGFWTTFNINNQAPDSLSWELDSDSYHPSETLTLSGMANDPDGIEDLSHVNLYLQRPNGTWSSLDTVRDFDSNGHFSQAVDLEGYGNGNYRLWGQVFDNQGLKNSGFLKSFKIDNQAPTDLNFSLDLGNYKTDDLINITGTLTDKDGFDDLLKVETWLRQPNNVWIDIPDITIFEKQERHIGTFNYDLNLNNVMGGEYQVWARGQDSLGATTHFVQQSFNLPL